MKTVLTKLSEALIAGRSVMVIGECIKTCRGRSPRIDLANRRSGNSPAF
jgi:hypothetical protein